jgi:hypothetical protein
VGPRFLVCTSEPGTVAADLFTTFLIFSTQTGDVALRFVDVSPQCCGMERGAVPLQPVHLANHLVPQIGQCPDQYLGLDCIAFTHRGIVAHADELGAMNRPATGERMAGR